MEQTAGWKNAKHLSPSEYQNYTIKTKTSMLYIVEIRKAEKLTGSSETGHDTEDSFFLFISAFLVLLAACTL